MKFELHPEAAANINRTVESLIPALAFAQPKAPATPEFEPDLEPDHVLTAEHKVVITGGKHMRGQTVDGLFFAVETGTMSLEGDGYRKLHTLAERLASQKPFKGHLSSSTIESDLFDWLRAKFLLETPPPPADKLLATAHGCVVERTYWIPIYGLYIQDDFQIGPVTFVTLSPDYWKQVLETLPQDKIEEFQEHFVKRKRLRNLAAGRVTYTSDITLGKRTSMDLVSNACAIIRLYHFCALTYHRSNCIPLGQQYDPSLTMLSSSGEGHWNVDMARIPDSEPIWEISRTKIHEMMTMGAFRLGDLLAKETPTEFESKVLQALLLFSRGSLARDTEERLLYVLAALESLLLANSSEPIQAKIGERLALCLGAGDYEKCQQIEARLREVYTIRSQFFHHGGRVVINETLELFLRDVWAFLISTIGELNKWTTKAEFLEAINRRKYSGHTEGTRKD